MIQHWLKIAWRNVVRNRRRSIVAIWTVAIVSTAIFLAYGYINFTFWGLTRVIVQGGTGNIQIADNRLWTSFEESALEFGINEKKANKIIKKMEQSPEVRLAMKRLLFSGIVSKGEISTVFRGTGIESFKESRLRQGNSSGAFKTGSMFKENSKNNYKIVLAIDLARKLNAKVGDSVTILSTTVEGGINAIDVSVAGIYDTGIPIVNTIELKVPLFLAQELLLTKKISRIVLRLQDIESTEISLPLIDKKLKQITTSNIKLSTRTWYELKPYFNSVKTIYYNIFTLMGIIILLVALLSVSNVMGTSVNERIPEVGTLRSFGIPKWQLRLNFVFEGFIVGFIGTIIGIVIGVILAFFINQSGYMMPPPPGRSTAYPLLILLTMDSAIIIMLGACLLGMIASYIPINKALKKKVIEQLNHI
jgi:putative ABC transport system permease protein